MVEWAFPGHIGGIQAGKYHCYYKKSVRGHQSYATCTVCDERWPSLQSALTVMTCNTCRTSWQTSVTWSFYPALASALVAASRLIVTKPETGSVVTQYNTRTLCRGNQHDNGTGFEATAAGPQLLRPSHHPVTMSSRNWNDAKS